MMTSTPTVAAIIVAAGQGTRLPGDVPKAYQPVQGRPMLWHTLERFTSHPAVGIVILVHHADHTALSNAACQNFPSVRCVTGGKERQDSVRFGLEALKGKSITHVLIHDAARPFVSRELIDRVLATLKNHPAVLPAVPVTDTIKQMHGQNAMTLPRDQLRAAQTPQGFDYATIHSLHRKYADRQATDDVMLAEWDGVPVTIIDGDPANRKITVPDDLATANNRSSGGIRIGSGFDVHAFADGEASSIRLCGVDVPSTRKLEGHSDGDAGLHAITDALFGALALGDLGDHFSSDDPQWKGRDSSHFLLHAKRLFNERSARIAHIDLTVIAQEPRIAPYRDAMRQRISEILDLSIDAVSVKATTTDHLGFTGRGEGVAAQAIVTVETE